MKKYIIIVFALAAVMAGCKKEGKLTPTEVRNWLEITDPGTGADAVDRKIYELYEKYGISVYYTDTIGREDRGWVDEGGNPVYYYEIIDPGYDLTVLAPGEALVWNRIEWWKPGQKARILPLLEYMDENMIPFVGVDKVKRIVLITNGVTSGNIEPAVYNGAGVVLLQLNIFEQEDGKVSLMWGYLQPMLEALGEGVFNEFYATAYDAFKVDFPSFNELENYWFYGDYHPEYPRTFRIVTWLDLTAERDMLEGLIAGGDGSAATAERYEYVTERLEVLNLIDADQADALAREDFFRAEYDRMRCEQYGFLALNDQFEDYRYFYMPREDTDLPMYLSVLLGSTGAEIQEQYGSFPVVLRRFEILRTILEDAGMNLDVLSR